jgi:site-specific DNA recombinase
MSKPLLRCAIYTRVSSDQGLEQDFNSLDAQREAAEAYIKSQAHEGWKPLRDRFDDGGYSGGTMERPALLRLLEVAKAERVDVIVVYKVDRLTRSLADFAKLVELFDAHKVSFVSVTQSFNTTTSMGRLTLNVLLSFAQFEREVTGERIRDKIAASKKRGLWMGGVVPLGYRVEDRKLVIEEEEAKIVRRIFERYSVLGSIPALQRELRDDGVVTRARKMARGATIGAVPLTNGPLSYILKNRHYLGEINHKGRSWPGEHAPIIDADLFDAVQAKLNENLNRTGNQKSRSGALLIGRIFDDRGNPMSPSHAVKKGVRYRYYVSAPIAQGRKHEAGSVARVPAEPIEQLVLGALRKERSEEGKGTASARSASAIPSDREIVANDLDRVVLQAERVDLRLSREAVEESDAETRIIAVPWSKPASVRRREIIFPEAPAIAKSHVRPIRVEEQARLLKAIAIARRWLDELIAGTVVDMVALAKREQKTERSVRMTLSLAFLDPAIVRAAVDGKLPRGYGVSRLVDLPPAFADQWTALGLVRPAAQ